MCRVLRASEYIWIGRPQFSLWKVVFREMSIKNKINVWCVVCGAALLWLHTLNALQKAICFIHWEKCGLNMLIACTYICYISLRKVVVFISLFFQYLSKCRAVTTSPHESIHSGARPARAGHAWESVNLWLSHEPRLRFGSIATTVVQVRALARALSIRRAIHLIRGGSTDSQFAERLSHAGTDTGIGH